MGEVARDRRDSADAAEARDAERAVEPVLQPLPLGVLSSRGHDDEPFVEPGSASSRNVNGGQETELITTAGRLRLLRPPLFQMTFQHARKKDAGLLSAGQKAA